MILLKLFLEWSGFELIELRDEILLLIYNLLGEGVYLGVDLLIEVFNLADECLVMLLEGCQVLFLFG